MDEMIIFLNSSNHSSKSSVNNSAGLSDDSVIANDNHDVIKLKDFISDSGNEVFIKDAKLTNTSFSSINSSIIGKSRFINEEQEEILDISSNNDLRGLFCHVLTKLDELEDVINTERNNYETMKIDYDKKLKNLKIENKNLSYEVDYIYDDLYSLDTRLVHCEQYSRRESIVISGIPDNIPQSELEITVIEILRRIGLNRMSSFEISACHRLYKNRHNKYPAKTIVKFTNRKISEYCLYHKDRLLQVSGQLQMNLRFHESLCETNRNIIKMCNLLSDYGFIKEYSVISGSIRIIKADETKRYKIKHPEVLYKMFKDFYDYEDLYIT